ncbi:MAG: metallophosphoesterase family protein [Clostridia bacterium]
MEDSIAVGESVDGVIHLGDYVRDAREAAKVYPNLPFYLVAGNGDSGTAAPSNQILELEGHRLYLCHGHRHLAGESTEDSSSLDSIRSAMFCCAGIPMCRIWKIDMGS